MIRPVIAAVAVLAGGVVGSATAADDSFHLSAPGVDIRVTPDDQRRGYHGTFRFGEGPGAFVGKGYFEIPDRSSDSSDSKTKDPCPTDWTLRDGSCQPNDK